jgi:TonB family protein
MTLTLLAILAWTVIQEPTPSPSPPLPRRVQGEIKEPKKLKHVTPDYPDEAVRAGLRGIVVLECVIDTEGRVADTRLLSGVPPLSDAAIKAVKKWRYTPTLLNGSAVPVIMTVTVNFKRELRFRLEELLDSLRSKNEFIRESAALWLGTARAGSGVTPDESLGIVRELRGLAEHDESERVRVAAARAIAHLEGK